jgi:DNA-binding ferritin-like protein
LPNSLLKKAFVAYFLLNYHSYSRRAENFYDSQEEIFDKVAEEIRSIFEQKKEQYSQMIREAILRLENIIEQQENLNYKSEVDVEKIQNNINTVLAQAIE